MPFFPSPGGDDGYDIIGFYGGAPPVGELGEWWRRSALPRTAGDHRDLVVDPSPASIPGPARLDPCSLKKGET
ncbi:MAG TPA: trehalose synthase, partial [Acidimicrobiia bacterium]|nr:trehalose synthase [Acidimicrobiia bacterium]